MTICETAVFSLGNHCSAALVLGTFYCWANVVDMEDIFKDNEMGKNKQKARKSDDETRRFF
jgi:hypothetical protein